MIVTWNFVCFQSLTEDMMILSLQTSVSSGPASQFRCCSVCFYSFTVDPVWQNKQIGGASCPEITSLSVAQQYFGIFTDSCLYFIK